MGYTLYIDHVKFPIAPESLSTLRECENTAVRLIDGTMRTLRRGAKLTVYETRLMLPRRAYPFSAAARQPEYYINVLNMLCDEKRPFWFDIYRAMPQGDELPSTNVFVTLERMEVREEAQSGFDISVALTMREYNQTGDSE